MQTIAPITPLPAITTSVLIDGTTQPGYAGTPLIAVGGGLSAIEGGVTISASEVTIRGMAVARVAVSPGEDDLLTADVQSPGIATSLALVDARGSTLVQSDGVSPSDPDDAIDEHISPGTYFLDVDSSRTGEFTLSTTLTPASAPLEQLPQAAAPSRSATSPVTARSTWRPPEGSTWDSATGRSTPAVGLELPEPISYYSAIVAGDFTGNGKLDLALADGIDNTVVVLMGNGDGTFQPSVSYDVGIDPEALVVGDFNGDGKLDLAVADGGSELNFDVTDPGGVSVLLGNGDGTFQPAVEYAAGISPDSLVAGDFGGNGTLDLAVADEGYINNQGATVPGGVAVLMGDGDGTFQPPAFYASGADASALVSGDFNGDGHIDLVYTDASSNEESILLGNGDGTFQAPRVIAQDYGPVTQVAGDFGGDGKLDLAVAQQDGEILVMPGNGDGTFRAPVEIAAGDGSPPISLAAGDFNADRKLDLAMADDAGLAVLLGNGDGTFQQPEQVVTGLDPVSLAAGDFTGDGKLDLATANTDATISIVLGNGDGSFQPQEEFSAGFPPSSQLGQLVTGDFNGDGRLDLAYLDEGDFIGLDNGGVYVALGNGNGTFEPAREVALLDQPHGPGGRVFHGR